jgi:transcriptional regulator of acetoin/glycerol metabolism
MKKWGSEHSVPRRTPRCLRPQLDRLLSTPNLINCKSRAVPAIGNSLAEQERRAIVGAPERSGGRISGPGAAAEALGLKPTTLYRKMRKHGIRKEPGPVRFG